MAGQPDSTVPTSFFQILPRNMTDTSEFLLQALQDIEITRYVESKSENGI